MYDQSNNQLITFHERVLRIQPSTVKRSRLLVLIHGLTGDENSMWVFVRNFPEDYWIISPRGPYRTDDPDAGYSWWPKLPRHGGNRVDAYETTALEDLRPAAEGLISLVDAYTAENNVHASQFDIIGFSQGGVLANTITMLYPRRIRRAGILASFIPANGETFLQDGALEGKPYFVAHGRLDEKVKVEYARRSVELLERAGAQVTYCEDEVGHKLGVNCLRALERFFAS